MLRRYLFFGACLLLAAVIFRFGSESAEGSSWLKTAIAPLAGFFLRTFNDSGTAISLCLVMLFSAAAILVYTWIWRIEPAVAQLRQIALHIADLPADGTAERLLSKLDEIFGRFPVLERPWRLFSRTLPASLGRPAGVPADLSGLFSLQALEAGGLRLRFFMGLPNDFVGFGLIFTFLGLVAGLYFASNSLMSGDLDASRAALNQLLHASTFKFLTSITGIGISIFLSWSQRIFLDRLQEPLDDIHFLLAERLAEQGALPHRAAAEPE